MDEPVNVMAKKDEITEISSSHAIISSRSFPARLVKANAANTINPEINPLNEKLRPGNHGRSRGVNKAPARNANSRFIVEKKT